MNKLKTVIAEDELPARNELNFLLGELEIIELVGQAENGEQALELIKDKQPQLVFLDIQMPGKTGLEVVNEIQALEQKPIIVFITAYDQYALKAFEVNAVDYILKPFEQEELEATVKRIKELYCNQAPEELKAKVDSLLATLQTKENKTSKVGKLPVCGKRGRIKLLPYEEVLAGYTRNKKVYVKTYNRDYEVNFNLTELEQELPADKFFRVHRSYLINLEEIKEIIPWFKGKYQVVLNDQTEKKIPVSRKKVSVIKETFNL